MRRTAGLTATVILVALSAPGLVLMFLPDPTGGALAGAWMFLYLPLGLLLLGTPTGLPVGRLWWVFWWGGVGVAGAFLAINVAEWASPDSSDVLDIPGFALLPCFLAFLIAAVIAPFARYRRADRRERLQLRWIFVAGASLPLTLLLCWVSYLFLGGPDLVVIGLVLAHIAIPAAVLIALLRPDWFDVDRVAIATLAVGALGILVLALLSLASVIAGLALLPWSPPIALVAAVILALGAVPAYRLVRRWLAWRLFPVRTRALAAFAELSTRVNEGIAEPEELEAVLREALRDEGLTVGIHRLADRSVVGLDGRALARADASAPIRLRGEEIGFINPSAASAAPVPQEVCRAAAPLVEAVRMRTELAHAAAELAASGNGSSVPATRSAGGSNATSTTARSSAWSHSACRSVCCSAPGPIWRPSPRRSTRRSPSSERRSPSCAGSRTGCGRAHSTTAWGPHLLTSCGLRRARSSSTCAPARCRMRWGRPPTTSRARRSRTRSSMPAPRASA